MRRIRTHQSAITSLRHSHRATRASAARLPESTGVPARRSIGARLRSQLGVVVLLALIGACGSNGASQAGSVAVSEGDEAVATDTGVEIALTAPESSVECDQLATIVDLGAALGTGLQVDQGGHLVEPGFTKCIYDEVGGDLRLEVWVYSGADPTAGGGTDIVELANDTAEYANDDNDGQVGTMSDIETVPIGDWAYSGSVPVIDGSSVIMGVNGFILALDDYQSSNRSGVEAVATLIAERWSAGPEGTITVGAGAASTAAVPAVPTGTICDAVLAGWTLSDEGLAAALARNGSEPLEVVYVLDDGRMLVEGWDSDIGPFWYLWQSGRLTEVPHEEWLSMTSRQSPAYEATYARLYTNGGDLSCAVEGFGD